MDVALDHPPPPGIKMTEAAFNVAPCPEGSADPLRFDPFDPHVRDDPSGLYRRLREESPIHKATPRMWIVSRHRDVMRIFNDPRFVSEAPQVEIYRRMLDESGFPSRLADNVERWLVFRDGVEHGELRNAVAGAFTPSAVERLRPMVRSMVSRAFEQFAESGEADIVQAVSSPLPIQVIAEVFGFDRSESEQLARSSLAISRSWEPFNTPQRLRRASRALDVWLTYFESQIEERRRSPRDDLLSRLVHGSTIAATNEELLPLIVFVFLAGHETTSGVISSCIQRLANDRSLWMMLDENRALVRPFVEEILRLESAVQLVMRTAQVAVTFDEQKIQAGDQVLLMLASANRDEDKHADASSLDFSRRGGHLAFGRGAHFCVGAPLARLQAAMVVERTLDTFDAIELGRRGRRRPSVTTRAFQSLPIRYVRKPTAAPEIDR